MAPDEIDRIAALDHDAAALEAAAHMAGPDAPVPWCPDWTVTDLLEHAGSVLYRASLIIGERREHRPHRTETTAPPGDPFGWFAQGHRAIVPVLRAADPDVEYLTFRGPNPLRWWLRRLADETLVHRVDAEQAAGIAPRIDAAHAVDGIDEKLDTYLPVVARNQCLGRALVVTLRADDTSATWTVALDADGEVTEPAAPPEAVAHGDAAALYLWFWRRAPDDSVDVDGDRTAATALRDSASV
ncbi:MAG TPA: maleylpyruvate isomerase family mycothiol-dependent enzyme [Gaiellaceae bacterium]|nr:maleylpyruvate isomerase family mycothiol-dependent enzyme [Gaiellaceae bacterium]